MMQIIFGLGYTRRMASPSGIRFTRTLVAAGRFNFRQFDVFIAPFRRTDAGIVAELVVTPGYALLPTPAPLL